MLKRTHVTPKLKQRTPCFAVKDQLPLQQQAVYKNFKEMCQRTSELKSWTLSSNMQNLKLLSMITLASKLHCILNTSDIIRDVH